jgi:ABC-2 type transport system ATP-binding protein
MMDSIIETHELTKYFKRRAAVEKVTLTVPRGAIFALLGDNGAGKTTTIRMLIGLLCADAGYAKILGQDCWTEAVKLRRQIGYVPEKPKFYDWMKVHELGWFAAGFHNQAFLYHFEQFINRFDLDPKLRLGKLSKGQYAKVALALALAPDPEVLVLDEPTSGLDLFVRREFLSSIVDLAGKGRTILISSHQIAEVARVASHAAFIEDGRLILAAPVDELKERVVRLRLRFEDQAPDAANLGRILHRNGVGKQWEAVVQDPNRQAVDSLRVAKNVFDFVETPLSLEETYLALMGKKVGQ